MAVRIIIHQQHSLGDCAAQTLGACGLPWVLAASCYFPVDGRRKKPSDPLETWYRLGLARLGATAQKGLNLLAIYKSQSGVESRTPNDDQYHFHLSPYTKSSSGVAHELNSNHPVQSPPPQWRTMPPTFWCFRQVLIQKP